MEMMDEALEEANLILSSIELITIKTLCFLAITFFCFFVFFYANATKMGSFTHKTT